jgi:hypothetical protein
MRQAPASSPLPPPSGFTVVETPLPVLPAVDGDPYRAASPLAPGPRLTIKWRQSGWILRLFVVAWNVIWWGSAAAEPPGFVMLVGVIGGLSGVYLLLVAWFNKAEVHADRQEIVYRAGPVWRRSTRLLTNEIDHLFTLEVRDSDGDPTYVIKARDRAGRDGDLLTLNHSGQARWIQDRLERHLGLQHRLADGEPGSPS